MIVYILKNDKLRKMTLPQKIYGAYSVLDDENKILANIESENGEWILKHNPEIEINVNGTVVQDTKLVNYGYYSIKKTINGEVTELYTTPMYDINNKQYVTKSNVVTIGSDPSCSIVYNFNKITPKHITLTKNGKYWVAQTEQSQTYISNRPFKKKNMFHGDYIFVFGLKIIIINDIFIINNPNGQVVVNSQHLEEKAVAQQQPTYQDRVSEDMPLYTKDQYFFKAPRFKSIIEKKRVNICPPPEKMESDTDPAILQIGPRLTMSITSFYTLINTLNSYMMGETTFERCIPSIMAVTVMLLSSLLWPTISRKYRERKQRLKEVKRQRKYKNYLEKKKKQIIEIKEEQRQILIENNIPLEECQKIIYNRKRNLWERNIEDDDFLAVRLGTGRVDCEIEIADPTETFTIEDEDNLLEALNETLEEAKYIDDCPMDVVLSEKQFSAVVGNNILTKYFMDSIFLQLMTFHSYTDLKIVVLTSQKNEYLWEYLKVTPHCWDNLKTNRYFATNAEEIQDVSSKIEKVFEDRLADDESEQIEDDGSEMMEKKNQYKKHRPYFLIFVDNLDAARNLSVIKKILNYKRNLGFSILFRNDRLSNLPSQCSTFINVDENISGLFENNLISNNQKQFKAELNKTVDMYGCAQKLANVPIQKEKAKYELPSSVSFLEMYNVGKVEQLNSLERWKTNNPVTSLAVPIGINQEGELFKMDAHEKGWGPHGLVAGMTGSGKSEWIITYILSLAVNFHPDEVQFVLIDYKGGGLALSFENKEMGIKLPHLAGTITNLDKSAINRALASIEAELKRRQHLFNVAREKLHESSINIYKYQQYYRKGMLDEPMSHLFIISDEFAELKSQQPEFLDQLVSTARIGRSLGVHLILATQKPSGVVNEQIWSNSRFHVCLRVQDKSDSNEMIKCADAAMLKTTGAFYLQVGYNEFFQLGQSAWAGAKYYPSDIVKKNIDQSIQYIDTLGNTINSYDENIFADAKPQENQGEELLNIVSYISEISKQETIVGRQLWLPNIKPIIYLSDVKQRYGHKPEKFNLTTVIGEYDNPSLQEQNVLKVNLENNIAIYGETGSGKENLITTLLWSSITEHSPQEVNYYIMDFGAETLRMFAKFPHVGEVVFQDDINRVAGVLDLILNEIETRKELFADFNGNYDSYIKESGQFLPRWVIVINAFDVFQEVLPRIVDAVNTMFRDGVKYGISFIVSTSSHTALRGKIATLFKTKLVLNMGDDSHYRTITNCEKSLIPAKEFGRGIAPINDEKFCEFQTALVCESSQINATIRKNADNFAAYYKTRAKSLPKIPDNVTSAELEPYLTTLEEVPVGYNFHEKDLAKFNFIKNKLTSICVSNFDNAMKSLYGIINVLSKVSGTKVRVFDFANVYKGNELDIKLFNQDHDAVLFALEKDLRERTIQQDHGITVILGAGIMKNKLSQAGKEMLDTYFESLQNANKSSVILVDVYDRMKLLKVENWYQNIDTSHGIWIGSGMENQNVFNVKAVNMEDRKLEFEGLAFLIDDSSYTVIKSVMDGDE